MKLIKSIMSAFAIVLKCYHCLRRKTAEKIKRVMNQQKKKIKWK